MLANDIYDKLTNDIEWSDIVGTSAQYYANHGYLVIAAWQNPNRQKSGHVAIVRPGMMGTSKKWGIRIPGVPKVANVGVEDSCRLDRGANWAFGKTPNYFVFLRELSYG